MNISDKGLAQLASEEGMVLGFYKDSVGTPTWGIGITPAGYAGFETLPKDPTPREVIEQFKRDVAKYERAVNDALQVPVTQAQFDALVSFHYNTGGIHKAALTKKLNAGDIAGAAKAFMGWRKPKSIIPRRKREQALFRGTYSGKAIAVYAAGGKRRLGSPITVAEFVGPPVRRPEPPRPDMAEVTPADIGEPITAAPNRPIIRKPAYALGATALVAALGVWWDSITAWVGGIFG